MIDTFQISKTFARPPEQIKLIGNGWKPLCDRRTGEQTALCLNAAKGEPRLTLSRDRNDFWIIRAEVSLGRWLHGSNIHLPNEDELHHGLDVLSEYVESRSGVAFDAHGERVSRVDFTRDFQVSENAVIPIIAKFANFELPRYTRTCFDETSVYFTNAGKRKNKAFKIYSKYHERLSKSTNEAEQETAKGILRLEVFHTKSAVNRLAKSLKLPNHNVNHILTKETSDQVIQKAIKLLHFDSLLTADNLSIEKLFEICSSTSSLSRIGFLYVKDKFGEGFYKNSSINISKRTYERCLADCKKAGILSLE